MPSKSLLFTAAASLTTGILIGSGMTTLLSQSSNDDGKVTAVVATPTASGAAKNGKAYETIVTKAVDDNLLHVRAHTWAAQFAMVSVCARSKIAEPKPCHYEADFTNAAGATLNAPKRGETVYLRNMSPTTGAVAAHSVTVDIPNIRPRQDKVSGPIDAKVMKIIDGDTAQIIAETLPGFFVITDVRVGEIDTPEKKGRAKCESEAALAEKATAATKALIDGKNVKLLDVQFEKYGGRMLGDIQTLDGVSTAQNLIDKNLAKTYDGGKKQSWCKL